MLVKVARVLDRVGDWAEYLAINVDEAVLESAGRQERTGCVLSGEPYIEPLKAALARHLKPGKQGPKPRQNQN